MSTTATRPSVKFVTYRRAPGLPFSVRWSTVKLDGCSPDGSAAKVLIVVAIPERNVIVAVYAQSLGTAESLLPFTQAVFETIRAV